MLTLRISHARGPCPICGTALCACRGLNEPYVGRPVDLAMLVEQPGGVGVLRAKKQIWVERNDGSGAQELLYSVGDPISAADAKALGLTKESVTPQSKPEKVPAESGGKVSRDKALRGPREAPKEESNG